jgi:hypothetical protein
LLLLVGAPDRYTKIHKLTTIGIRLSKCEYVALLFELTIVFNVGCLAVARILQCWFKQFKTFRGIVLQKRSWDWLLLKEKGVSRGLVVVLLGGPVHLSG